MDPFLASGIIGAGASLVGSIGGGLLNRSTSYNMQRREQQFNKQMAEYQNQQNLAFWQMQNNYNTPARQVQRLQEAGLNPALIYGNGSTSTGNATSAIDAAKVNAAPANGMDWGDLGAADAAKAFISGQQMSLQNKLAQSQVDLQKAQEQEHLQKALESAARTANLNADTGNKLWQYNYNSDVEQLLKDQLATNVAFTKKNIQGVDSKIALNGSQISKIGEEINLIRSQVGVNYAQAANLRQSIEESAARIALMATNAAGNELDNRFKNETFDDRVKGVEASLQGSLIKNREGELTVNREVFKNNFRKIYGYEPGDAVWNALPALLGKVLNDFTSIFGAQRIDGRYNY